MNTGSSSATHVYLVGSGIAALASAVYLIKDAGIPGPNILVLEQDEVIGGALDGHGDADKGFLIRGGRMHEEKFVCYWDLLSNIPVATDSAQSVTEETFAFNQRFVSCARSRLLREAEIVDVSSFGLGLRDKFDLTRLTLAPEQSLGNKRIQDWFQPTFFHTNFWRLWESMFAFQIWSSLVEMRRYVLRFMHLFPGLHELRGIYRTVYNQYDSVVLPLQGWLKAQGVRFSLKTRVVDIDFHLEGARKTATAIHCVEHGAPGRSPWASKTMSSSPTARSSRARP